MNEEIVANNQSNVTIFPSQVQTMSSLEIAELTGKLHQHVKRDIEAVLNQAGIDASRFGRIYKDKQNRGQTCYHLPRRECDLVISGYSVPYRLAIIDRWHALEKKSSIPNFENPIESAHAWIEQFKAKKQAEVERDEAIRTKAHISDKKTATAMARAANEKRRADKLEQQLGEHISWKKAKAIDWIPVVFQLSQGMWCQIGKYLKRVSDEMGIEARDIPDTTHNTVKAYHIDVITEAYKRIKEDPNILSKYRALGRTEA